LRKGGREKEFTQGWEGDRERGDSRKGMRYGVMGTEYEKDESLTQRREGAKEMGN
jgi:hypothetical protein